MIAQQRKDDETIRVEVQRDNLNGGPTVAAADSSAVTETGQTELNAAQAQAEEYLDQLRRTAAEFANYKKRIDRERSAFTQLATTNLISKLLPVMDDFERAFDALPEDLHASTWVDGFAMIQRKLQAVLDGEGVEIIDAEGHEFDPQLHQAVTYEDSEEFGEGKIIAQVQKGYRIGDRILRASMVRVAR